jgi:ER membrane protein complex subunit 3
VLRFKKVMMQGIQHFFSGFILLRIPFPLTVGFKNMFQKGMAELPNLESSYVSSVSWYFLVMYGLRSFFKLVMGTPPQEQREQEMYQQTKWGLQMPPNPSSPKQDPESLAKLLNQEADNLELLLLNHKSELDSVEKRLLGKRRYPKRQLATSSEADFLLGGGTSSGKGKKSAPTSKTTLKKKQ